MILYDTQVILILEHKRQTSLNATQALRGAFEGHSCGLLGLCCCFGCVCVSVLRRPIVRTADCWSIGWDGGGVGRFIVMIHVLFSLSLSLSPLISSLFKIFSVFFLFKSWILCVICWFADRVRNVPFLPAHHTSPDSKS